MLMALLKMSRAVWRPFHAGEGRRHCLTFMLDGVRFGIDTRFITQVLPWGILAIPHDKPTCVRGFLRHDERMIPVLDIAARYGHNPLTPGKRTCLLVLSIGLGRWQHEVALMVDEVLSVQGFAADALRPVPEAAHRMMQVEVVEGLLKQKDGFLIALDALRLLPDEELYALVTYIRQTWPCEGRQR